MISTIESLIDTVDDVPFLEEILVECCDAAIYDSITDYKASTIKRGIDFLIKLKSIGVYNSDEFLNTNYGVYDSDKEFLIEFLNDIGEEISESLVIDWAATWVKVQELHSIKKINFEGSNWYFNLSDEYRS